MRRAHRFPRTFLRDRSGVAAIEFALILPLLVLILFGTMTLFHFYRTGLTLDRATATVSDFMSRQSELSTTFMTERVASSLDRLVPHDPGQLGFRITSLTRTGATYRTEWTYPSTPGPGFEGRALPMDVLPVVADGDSLLLTETFVLQRALVDVMGVGAIGHRATLAVRPRFAKSITGPV